MSERVRDDRIFPETRITSIAIMLVLLAAFVTLYFWPDDTERLFAWTIRPRMTPLLMGSGYIGGAYLFMRVIFASRWHRVGQSFLPVAAFAAAMLLATVLHWDRFNHEHVWFWIWLLVYGVTPFLMPALYLRNRVVDPRAPEPDDVTVPRVVSRVFGVFGATMLAIALLLLLFPAYAISIWPWQLTPLTARVVGGWYTLSGTVGLVIALESRWSALRHMTEGSLIWTALLLLAVWRAWDDFNGRNPLTWFYIGSIALSLVGIAALYLAMEGRRRKTRRGGSSLSPDHALGT